MTDRREEREAYNARERAVDRLESDPGAVASAFKEVFGHPKAPIVLAWFLDTCRATETTLDENPLVMAAAEGRRQVWCAMNDILSMDARDIAAVRNAISRWEDRINE